MACWLPEGGWYGIRQNLAESSRPSASKHVQSLREKNSAGRKLSVLSRGCRWALFRSFEGQARLVRTSLKGALGEGRLESGSMGPTSTKRSALPTTIRAHTGFVRTSLKLPPAGRNHDQAGRVAGLRPPARTTQPDRGSPRRCATLGAAARRLLLIGVRSRDGPGLHHQEKPS